MGRTQYQPARFDRDETADILDLAGELERRTTGDGLEIDLADVYRIARELGISDASVDEAIHHIVRRGTVEAKEARRSVRRRMRFIRHALAYIVTVSILALVDALGGDGWWVFYIAGFWGIILALHGLRLITRRNGPLETRLGGG